MSELSYVTPESIERACSGIRNGDIVASTVKKQLVPKDPPPAPDAKSMVPLQAQAISANEEVVEQNMSAADPGMTLETGSGERNTMSDEGFVLDKLSEAALDKIVRKLQNG